MSFRYYTSPTGHETSVLSEEIMKILPLFIKICILFLCTGLLSLDISATPIALPSEKPMVIITTSYNNAYWARRNLRSIFSQDYSNYRVIYIDDASEDDTADIVEQFIHEKSKKIPFTLIRNTIRQGALANIYYAVLSCKDEEIIVSLDGDDWLYNTHVLEKINAAYASQNVWLTHGFISHYPGAGTDWSLPIPDSIVAANAFRTYRCPSHLRTFYAWLFKKIGVEDLKYEGQFFPMTWDQAMMFPMIEMAGDRHAYFSEPTYVYNVANPINDNKIDARLQNELERYIRSKPPYARLETSPLELEAP